MADFDVAENLCPRSYQHTATDFGMTILVFLASTAERDTMQDRDVVLDHSGFTAHKAGGVIEEDTAADPGGRVDVGLKHRRGAALKVIGKILARLAIEPVRETVGLQRVKTLEIEQRIDEPRCRGIPIVYRHQVGSERISQIRLIPQRLVVGLAYQIA